MKILKIVMLILAIDKANCQTLSEIYNYALDSTQNYSFDFEESMDYESFDFIDFRGRANKLESKYWKVYLDSISETRVIEHKDSIEIGNNYMFIVKKIRSLKILTGYHSNGLNFESSKKISGFMLIAGGNIYFFYSSFFFQSLTRPNVNEICSIFLLDRNLEVKKKLDFCQGNLISASFFEKDREILSDNKDVNKMHPKLKDLNLDSLKGLFDFDYEKHHKKSLFETPKNGFHLPAWLIKNHCCTPSN